jgi:hypothetical protein
MQMLLFLLVAVVLIQCKNTDLDTDVVYTDLQPDQKIIHGIGSNNAGGATSATFLMEAANIDLNRDGFKDYTLYIRRTAADGTYYPKDENSIFIRPVSVFLQERNGFDPQISVDTSLRIARAPYFSGMAKFYGLHDNVIETFPYLEEYYLYKDDFADSYRRNGTHSLALRMEKDNKNYYGWLQLTLEDSAVIVKDYAFCTTPERKIAMGTRR